MTPPLSLSQAREKLQAKLDADTVFSQFVVQLTRDEIAALLVVPQEPEVVPNTRPSSLTAYYRDPKFLAAYHQSLADEFKKRAGDAAPQEPPQDRLPKRNVPALIEALRIRALALTGEAWERSATREMMKEAAQMLEDLSAAPAPAQGWQPTLQEAIIALFRLSDAETITLHSGDREPGTTIERKFVLPAPPSAPTPQEKP